MGAAVVENAVRRVIEPHVDQLAGLITYSGLATATSAWLARALVNLLTDANAIEVWDQAVARAKASLRQSMQDEDQYN